jgi:hypothetical protein
VSCSNPVAARVFPDLHRYTAWLLPMLLYFAGEEELGLDILCGKRDMTAVLCCSVEHWICDHLYQATFAAWAGLVLVQKSSPPLDCLHHLEAEKDEHGWIDPLQV